MGKPCWTAPRQTRVVMSDARVMQPWGRHCPGLSAPSSPLPCSALRLLSRGLSLRLAAGCLYGALAWLVRVLPLALALQAHLRRHGGQQACLSWLAMLSWLWEVAQGLAGPCP